MELLPKRAKIMGIDPEKDLESMALVAKLQVVWATTTAYQVAKETDDAEKRVLGMTREMKPADYTVLRLQYEQLVKSKKKKQDLPGKTILENMNQELEDGEFRAPRLIEIPSQAEVEQAIDDRTDSHGVAGFQTSTGIRVSQNIKVKIPPIEDPEEYRTRINLLAAAVEFTKIKNPAYAILETADAEMWSDHKEYILGEKVRLKETKRDNVIIVRKPTWDLVLQYEQAIRQRAAELMNEGTEENGKKPMDIKRAFLAAQKCEETRREHFLDPLHLQQVVGHHKNKTGASFNKFGEEDFPLGKRQRNGKHDKEVRDFASKQGGKPDKGKGKKGKGKGKGGKLPKGVNLANTYQKKQICYGYGTSTCKANKCKMLHICQICFGQHPWMECKRLDE